ncbi:MAG: ergothioneine biosynthesis protein EgtB [Candidatus Bathyarchaeota archaeon]
MTALSEQEQKEPLLEQFKQTRKRTLDIVKTLEKDDFVVQTAFYMSPPKWHVGHVSWIYEAIMSKLDKSYEFYSKEFSEYLNSYYQQFGVPHDKGSRGIISRPTVDQIFQYFNNINQRVENFIQSRDLTKDEIRLITMGSHHECQHQELMIYDLQRIYEMGYNGNSFCYDIELPEHKVFLENYKIDAFPITNDQYLEFIEDGGYDNYKFWLSDGWEKVEKNKWDAPMYWEKIEGKWMVRDFLGLREINPNEPVCHVSFYEADAYCKWAGKRLPTEAEWEKAATWNESSKQKTIFPWGNEQPNEQNANLLESNLWGCTEIGSYPDGVSHFGCHQMIGDVWEWTSSEFTGYPGFKSGFDEYNDKWFTNQKVLRGGSFGTPKMSIRGSYRNFFRLDERWLFCGFRCAENV